MGFQFFMLSVYSLFSQELERENTSICPLQFNSPEEQKLFEAIQLGDAPPRVIFFLLPDKILDKSASLSVLKGWSKLRNKLLNKRKSRVWNSILSWLFIKFTENSAAFKKNMAQNK